MTTARFPKAEKKQELKQELGAKATSGEIQITTYASKTNQYEIVYSKAGKRISAIKFNAEPAELKLVKNLLIVSTKANTICTFRTEEKGLKKIGKQFTNVGTHLILDIEKGSLLVTRDSDKKRFRFNITEQGLVQPKLSDNSNVLTLQKLGAATASTPSAGSEIKETNDDDAEWQDISGLVESAGFELQQLPTSPLQQNNQSAADVASAAAAQDTSDDVDGDWIQVPKVC